MVADKSVSRLHAYFRDLFLEELRADDGWAEYIDLLVRHLDLSGFDYLQEGGVPYYFRFEDFLGLSWNGDVSGVLTGGVSACVVARDSTAFYVALNAPRGGGQWLDFSAGTWVRVARQKCVYADVGYDPAEGVGSLGGHVHTSYYDVGGLWRPEVLEDPQKERAPEDVAENWYTGSGVLEVTLLEGARWLDRVELTTYSAMGTSSQPCMLIMRIPLYIEESYGVPLEVAWGGDLAQQMEEGVYSFTQPVSVGSKWYIPVDWSQVGFHVDGIPHRVNGAMVRSVRMGSGVGQTLYGVAPSARSLFGTMYGLGLDYERFPFRFYLSSGVSLGESRIEYPEYISIRSYLDPMRSVRALSFPSAVSGVSGSSESRDVLRDRWPVIGWGYGASLGNDTNADVVGFVASEPTPTDALRDRWGVDVGEGGTGEFRLVDVSSKDERLRALFTKYGRSIFGYDKKLWVVINNGDPEQWYYLGSPYASKGKVSFMDEWDHVVRWDAGGRIMTPPTFQLESDTEELKWIAVDGPQALSQVLKPSALEGFIGEGGFDVYTGAGSFVIGTPSNGDIESVTPLCTELSHPVILPEGLTKVYDDLSVQQPVVPIDRLTVAITGTREAFGEYLLAVGLISSLDELDSYLEWLEGVLGRSVPVGIGVSILFVPPSSVVDLELGVDAVTGVHDGTGVEGVEVYLLTNPGEVHMLEGVDVLHPVVVRSNVGWWVDLDVSPVLGVRLGGSVTWEKSVGADVTDGDVTVEVYGASEFGIK